MSRVFVAVAVLTLAVAAAGCGSKKSSSPPTTTASQSSSSSGGGSTPSFASVKNCKDLEQMAVKLGQAIASAGQGASVTDVSKVYSQMAAAAPSEIRGDLETLAGVFQKYAEAIAKAGYKPGTVPTAAQIAALQNVAKTFDDPKLKTAEAHLEAWGKSHCGNLGNG